MLSLFFSIETRNLDLSSFKESLLTNQRLILDHNLKLFQWILIYYLHKNAHIIGKVTSNRVF